MARLDHTFHPTTCDDVFFDAVTTMTPSAEVVIATDQTVVISLEQSGHLTAER